ncbi:glycine cleavage system protein H [Periweissella beninensis]|uniref:glycine cleavage system protein H n=1 Tax=Periweissella beninensis TaxID=504936 RepID=UPI0021A854B6|nr:glycine cleavage system protein H [Periweissella beninensis]MCT4395626.1 glycine cleavage system protein H [Periweissella beninensis]
MAEDWYWQEEKADSVRLGITTATQEELGDVAYVELPKVDTKITAGEFLVSIEATKAVLDFDSPFNGIITKINAQLIDQPANLNKAKHADNWLVEIQKDND